MGGKVNCWEYNKCGRQQNGEYVDNLGVCPSSTEKKLHGVHGGTNAGRACWVVSGTLCKGEVQGTFAQKFKNCTLCNFYRQVKQDEHPNFLLSPILLKKCE